jgi:hypothetical protein
MYRPFSRLARLGAGLLAGATIALALPYASLAEDRDAGPAMATSEDPDDMTVGTEDPDSLVTGTEDSDDMTVGTENPDDMLTGTLNPDDLLATTENPDDMVVETTDIADLPAARKDPAEAQAREETEAGPDAAKQQVYSFAPSGADGSAAEGSSRGSWEAKLATTKARLDGARRDAERWNAAYSRAVTSNEPRGQARAEIVAKRDEAQEEVKDAEKELAAVSTAARRAGVNPMMIEGLAGAH